MGKLKPNQFHLPSGGLITERPILFQTDMVKAILDGRKTQTRRTKGLEEVNSPSKSWSLIHNVSVTKNGDLIFGFKDPTHSLEVVKCPYGKPGDLLWVRETWGYTAFDNEEISHSVVFKADYADIAHLAVQGLATDHWKPSIHMPKTAARIWLMLEEVSVEQLNEISEEDAIAEGIEPIYQHGQLVWKRYDGYYTVTSKPYCSFWSLWASINGEESWNANPWVWVVKFRVLTYIGKPNLGFIEYNYHDVMKIHADREKQSYETAAPDSRDRSDGKQIPVSEDTHRGGKEAGHE